MLKLINQISLLYDFTLRYIWKIKNETSLYKVFQMYFKIEKSVKPCSMALYMEYHCGTWISPTQAHSVEMFWLPVDPSRLSQGHRGGQKGPQKWELSHFGRFGPRKSLGGGHHQKHKSYLRYWKFISFCMAIPPLHTFSNPKTRGGQKELFIKKYVVMN